MLKKTMKILVVLVSILLFTQKAYANVDIELRDNKELQEVSVIVNSNDKELIGIDLPIIFSKDVDIEEVTKTNFCSFMFNGEAEGNKIDIECFNDPEIIMNGELAKIKYNTNSKDYFFYIDSEKVDTGGEELGTINNVNKPSHIVNPNINTEKVDTGKSNIKLSLIASIVFLVLSLGCLILLIVTLVTKKKEEKKS